MPETGEYIYVIRPTRPAMLTEGPNQAEKEALGGHIEHLNTLAREGVVLLAGRTQTADENTFGIVIFKAGSYGEAQRLMESDPAVSAGVMQANLYPYKVAVLSETYVTAA